jgi:hypothetical protein
MHPYEYEQLISARQDDLARAAARAPQPGRPSARRQLQQNAGWLLVHVGLRLALGRQARSAAAGRA